MGGDDDNVADDYGDEKEKAPIRKKEKEKKDGEMGGGDDDDVVNDYDDDKRESVN